MEIEMRPDKIEYYLDIAKAVSKRATCLRRKYGAIIVCNEQVVASGYCGAPRGIKDCLERNSCLRTEMDIPHGQRYELCRSVHAEQNAIINAARSGTSIFGGDLYVWSYCSETKKIYNGRPCLLCLKMTINAGLKRIYYSDPEKKQRYNALYLDGFVRNWNDDDILEAEEQ